MLFAIVSVSPRARGMEGLPKVHSDHHLGEGVSATPSVVPSVTDDETLAAESDPALGALAGKLHRFAVRNHRFFAGFAAAKYTKHGPGALFQHNVRYDTTSKLKARHGRAPTRAPGVLLSLRT